MDGTKVNTLFLNNDKNFSPSFLPQDSDHLFGLLLSSCLMFHSIPHVFLKYC